MLADTSGNSFPIHVKYLSFTGWRHGNHDNVMAVYNFNCTQ